MAEAKDKITLTVRRDVARKVRALGRSQRKTVSELFEQWVMSIPEDEDPLLALAGLWKDRDITLEDIRAKAWARS